MVREVHLEVALAARADALVSVLHDLAVGLTHVVQAAWSLSTPSTSTRHRRQAPQGGHALLVTQRGDVDPFTPRHVEHRLALAGGELAAVDGEL